ncbi:hypothetical protein DUNSADRAFT_10887 [Dunaliella salina]|uniref:ESX-1 secretion-associated protein EspA/EspE-like domain-containing protein n=1 Tax=Dunaliella salina TaxID=3046 RepID=A0ABQ7H4M9_DUNSA|nr:hypothetical protein DUNSADRAFT_10887 [Dunaliella salina]|eukprot:KAF5841824.1 hypothetical protein DUNSADRAFT_10887 [Dunaliella salina]
MYLILSTTKIVVLGQKAAFKNAGGIGGDSGSAEDNVEDKKAVDDTGSSMDELQQNADTTQDDRNVADFLSRLGLFGSSSESAGDDMTTSGGNGTEFRGSAFSDDGTALNEDISFLLRMANQTGMDPEVTSAIEQSLRQQQSTGSLRGVESAASTVANFLRLPSTIGTGKNLKLFASQLDAMQDLRNRVSGLLRFDQLRTIDNHLITAQQLALGWVAAFPLAQLTFIVAALALAASILALLGGIFYIVASSLLLASSINAAASLNFNSGKATSVKDEEWYAQLRDAASSVSDKIMPLAFSEQGSAPVYTAIAVLDLADGAIDALAAPGGGDVNDIFPEFDFSDLDIPFGGNVADAFQDYQGEEAKKKA